METPVTSHGEVIDKPEFDFITTLAQELGSWFVDLYAGQNVVQPGGGVLGAQAGTPIVVTYTGFTALVNGPGRMSRYVVSSGTVTLAAADGTNPRYDLIVGTASQTTGTDSGGQPTTKDVLTVTKVTGTPAGTPTIPSLPVNSVQLGYVLVPANATSAQTCTITQSVGPLTPKNLQDLTNHIPASMATAVVHGFQATLPGGTGANQLAQTGARGGVGALEGNWWVPGIGQTPTTDGYISPRNSGSAATDGAYLEYFPPTTGSNTAAKLTISAALTAALALLKLIASTVEITGGLQVDGPLNALGSISAVSINATTITQSGAAVATLDSNSAVALAEKAFGLVAAGVTHHFTAGHTTITATNNGTTNFTVTLDDGSFTPTIAVPGLSGTGTATGLTAYVTAIAAGSVGGYVYNGGGQVSVTVNIFAYA